MKTCETCRYWDKITRGVIDPTNPRGLCRVGPPEVAKEPASWGRWPLTLATDWCGIHAAPDEAEDDDDFDVGGEA